ncbi:hypothetical protein CgunFtcFv8_025560 [Champsocephalus gunnari]|uniref:Uncharacterized protein n=1 Tax=Champsocephalus gunnari TaxID=52237 RepID=A0AAN8CFP5_CHAGU|nr:hypothetical protein CgunFtcFv8_025560 [Champsocephalus gunnari]
MILNSCLTVIEKRVDGVFAANSHVIPAWCPPSSTINPMQHLPENAANLQLLLLPVWEPGHWTLCIPCGTGWRDDSRTKPFRNLAQILCPGPWASLGVDDVQDTDDEDSFRDIAIGILLVEHEGNSRGLNATGS